MAYHASSDIWGYWNGHQATGTSLSNLQATIWANWVTQTTSATNVNTYRADIWERWNTNQVTHISQQNLRYGGYVPPVRPEPTPEELRAQKEQREQYARDREALRLITIDADTRAKALLLDHLDDQQKRDYAEKDHFDVEVDGKTYRIQPGTHGNVIELGLVGEKEVAIRRFCIPSRVPGMPEADVHLSQKLMIEGAMDEFERIANITPFR